MNENNVQNLWDFFAQPVYIVIYIAIVIFLMLLIVISVMMNEHRFNAVTKKLQEDAKKAEEKDRLKKENDERQKAESYRFDMLRTLDEQNKAYVPHNYEEFISLRDLCDEFRIFAADKLKLYYDIDTIREFISALAVSHIVILQGMSGTGKTSLAYAFGEFLGNPSTIIPVQPMWKERTDLLGYYNEFTKRFNETLLLQKLYEANARDDIYITILDELNIARVEYYFAEFLSLLEIPNPEARYLEVVSDKLPGDPEALRNGRIKLAENMWFIGTANNDDSTFAISDKVYDRAMVLNLDRKCEPFEANMGRSIPISACRFMALVEETLKVKSVSQQNLDRLAKLDQYVIEKFQISFGNRIMRQICKYLPIYVSCGGDELDALDDILSKKILRKLETLNSAYVRSEAEDLINYISELFGEDKMPRCKEYIRRIARNA